MREYFKLYIYTGGLYKFYTLLININILKNFFFTALYCFNTKTFTKTSITNTK